MDQCFGEIWTNTFGASSCESWLPSLLPNFDFKQQSFGDLSPTAAISSFFLFSAIFWSEDMLSSPLQRFLSLFIAILEQKSFQPTINCANSISRTKNLLKTLHKSINFVSSWITDQKIYGYDDPFKLCVPVCMSVCSNTVNLNLQHTLTYNGPFAYRKSQR